MCFPNRAQGARELCYQRNLNGVRGVRLAAKNCDRGGRGDDPPFHWGFPFSCTHALLDRISQRMLASILRIFPVRRTSMDAHSARAEPDLRPGETGKGDAAFLKGNACVGISMN